MLLLPVLVLGLVGPAAATAAKPADSPGAVHTDFEGLYFPAGLEGTGTECPGEWMDPALCVTDQGSWTFLPSGRIRIRNMEVFELAFAWNEDGVEERKTGYDVVVANANLDGSFSGPTWGTWSLYNFNDELMFTGRFTGKFANGVPAVHFVGRGTGAYEGQHMSGDVGRVADPYNMFGTIVEPVS
ncbi:MAG: hypothetical protein M3094_08110 [Actinomycetia bacterium]|nr:hypothetical protein [Actinomycetes bacterium]